MLKGSAKVFSHSPLVRQQQRRPALALLSRPGTAAAVDSASRAGAAHGLRVSAGLQRGRAGQGVDPGPHGRQGLRQRLVGRKCLLQGGVAMQAGLQPYFVGAGAVPRAAPAGRA